MAGSIGTLVEWEYPRTENLEPAYVSVGCIVDANAPPSEKEIFQDRCLNQDDVWTGKIAGFLDGGRATLRLKFNKTTYAALMAAHEDVGPSYRFRIIVMDHVTLGSRSAFTFRAQVATLGLPFPESGDRLVADVGLEIDGKVTFTPGV